MRPGMFRVMGVQAREHLGRRPAAVGATATMVSIVAGDAFGTKPFLHSGLLHLERTQTFANDLAFGRVGTRCDLVLHCLRHRMSECDAERLSLSHEDDPC